MSISSLLNKGNSHKSLLENAADKILYAPRKLWAKQIQVTYNAEISTYKTVEKGESFHHKLWSSLGDEKKSDLKVMALGTIYGIFYGISSTALAFPLALGLSIKQIALHRNQKSLYYNKLIQTYLKLDEYTQKQSALIASKEATDQKIKNLESFLEMPIENLENRIVQSWKLELLSQKNAQASLSGKLSQVATKIDSIKNDLAYYQLKYEKIHG